VKQAIKDQVDKLSCEFSRGRLLDGSRSFGFIEDVYNMQMSNEPAEELAQFLIDESKGAFSLCGFVCGGNPRARTVQLWSASDLLSLFDRL
jgi:FPC/CPF motif-containing protein YcgG